jgi:hypothetical protein
MFGGWVYGMNPKERLFFLVGICALWIIWLSRNRLIFLDFYFSFYHYAFGMNLVAAQWFDGIWLVPLFVIIQSRVLFT